MTEIAQFQKILLLGIIMLTLGVLILVGMGKTIDSVSSTIIGSVLSGLIGALGGHAIASNQPKIEDKEP